MSECKHCENCDLSTNKCLQNNSQCYQNGKCLHDNCQQYQDGKWFVPDGIEYEEGVEEEI